MLSVEELFSIEENLRDILDERLEEILIRLNRSEKLDEFLKIIGLPDLLGKVVPYEHPKDGIIIVIGESSTNVTNLIGVAKELGFKKDRFEFCLEYEAAKRYDFKKTQYSQKYSCILVGPMPHSGKAKGGFSSIITKLEYEDGYPPVYRMAADELKITNSSFRKTLNELVEDGLALA